MIYLTHTHTHTHTHTLTKIRNIDLLVKCFHNTLLWTWVIKSWWNRKGPSHKALHCQKMHWYAKALRFLNTRLKCLSLVPSHYSVCVCLKDTHFLRSGFFSD